MAIGNESSPQYCNLHFKHAIAPIVEYFSVPGPIGPRLLIAAAVTTLEVVGRVPIK